MGKRLVTGYFTTRSRPSGRTMSDEALEHLRNSILQRDDVLSAEVDRYGLLVTVALGEHVDRALQHP